MQLHLPPEIVEEEIEYHRQQAAYYGRRLWLRHLTIKIAIWLLAPLLAELIGFILGKQPPGWIRWPTSILVWTNLAVSFAIPWIAKWKKIPERNA